MKKLLYIILILLVAVSVQAATYYVKTGGNDSADGLSDGNAWATIGKVNSVSLSNDDTVKFNRGDTFDDATLTLNSTSAAVRVIRLS